MDDLISRQALRSEMYHEAFEKDSNEQRWDSGCWIRYKMFERIVDRQPSAQRTGRWIKHEVKLFNGCHTGRYFDECSECGKLTTEWRKVTEYHRWNFCPNCGARMEGKE